MTRATSLSSLPLLRGFPPVSPSSPHTLILGSFPSPASLTAGAYYAHPRNAFWPIMGAIFGFDPQSPYPERIEALTRAGIALWDTIGACIRPGSRDDAIDLSSVIPNPVASFILAHPTLTRIVTNGTLATRLFRRFVWVHLPIELRTQLRLLPLPSTSPAHALRSYPQKLHLWRAALLGDRV
ncbi:MAG: DNA-deoxyinosine glycosylase [Hydrogenophilus sp.]|nr:DNA-deoxyinosine glycosylase [Hydrogenophilus sp.]